MNVASSQRYLSLWLRRLPTDRTARVSRTPSEKPFALVGPCKNARILTAVNDAAARLGLREGQRFADACAMHPALGWAEADAQEDARLLGAIAEWCERYTPLVGTQPPDGVILDITGCAHLFGGEAALVGDLLEHLAAQGFRARAGVAGTVGAAWAFARYGEAVIVPSARIRDALAVLPLAALRLEAETRAALSETGLKTAGDIMARPRAPLAARFGGALLQRLDQALGREEEPITPRIPLPPYSVEQGFSEPLSRDEDLLSVLALLTERLCVLLEERGEGARQLLASFFGVDGAVRRLALGTSRPLRDAERIHRLFADKFALSSWQDEFGYDRIRLAALAAEPFGSTQKDLAGPDEAPERAHLIDRLTARLGPARVLRLMAQDTHVPEFACVAVPAASAGEFFPVPPRPRPLGKKGTRRDKLGEGEENDCIDSLALPRPLRLFAPAEPIEAVAEVPDGPPVRFRWRRVLHAVARAEGPERIAMPWWGDAKDRVTRDYFRVESREGARFWLYRQGLYGCETARPRWFLHGLLP